MADSTARGKRGPYKRYLKDPNFPIPKQTLSNWRKRDCKLDTSSSSTYTSQLIPPPADQLPDLVNYDESEFCRTIASPAHFSTSLEMTPTHGQSPTSSDDESTTSTPCGQSPSPLHDESQSPTPSDDESMPTALDGACSSDVNAYASGTAFEASSLAQNLLYPSAQISVATGTLLLHSLTVKHGLTQTALTDILQLIRLHMPANSAPQAYGSVYRLLNASSLKSNEEMVCKHVLCKDCGELISEASNSGSSMECVHSHVVQFYELQLHAQIQALFKGVFAILMHV